MTEMACNDVLCDPSWATWGCAPACSYSTGKRAQAPWKGGMKHRHTAPCCGNVGESLGATGGQGGGILICGVMDTPSQGRHTLLPNTPQHSGAVHSSPAQAELVPSEPAASAPLSRHSLVCCSSHTVSSPCWAFSSWSHPAASLCSAPPLPGGQIWARAKHQLTQSSAIDLPQACRQDPELSKCLPTAHIQVADMHG